MGKPSSLDSLFERLAELVRARGRATVAADALDTVDDVLGFMTDDEFGDTLEIAVAATNEIAALNDVVVIEFDMDEARECA